MLPFLIPPSALVRASSHLARRTQIRSKQQTYRLGRPSSSSALIQNDSPTARHDRDLEDRHEAGVTPARRHRDREAFSHFFDRRAPPPTAPTSSKPKVSHEISAASCRAVDAFRKAISIREPAAIIEAYQLVIQAHHRHAQDVRNSSSRDLDPFDIGFPIHKTDIQKAVHRLVKHAQREGIMPPHIYEACHQMFRDMTQLFGFRIASTDLHRNLQTYCLAQEPTLHPCQAFEKLRASHPYWKPNSSEFGMVIAYLEQNRSYAEALELWNEMLRLGVEVWDPLRDTMTQILRALNNTAEADTLRQQLSPDEAHSGVHALTSTVEELCRIAAASKRVDPKLMTKLRTHATDLRKALDSNPQLATDVSAWHALLRCQAIVAGPALALQTAKQAARPGLFDNGTLCMLLRLHVDELNDLQSSDDALDLLDRVQSAIDPKRTIQLDDQCYYILMLGLLNMTSSEAFNQDADLFADRDSDGSLSTYGLPSPNQVREAQLLFDYVRALGVAPTPLLVKPLLTAYCEAFLPSLPSAMKLVQDLLDHETSSSPSTRQTATSARCCSRTSAIGISTFRPVLDACIKLWDLACARDLLSRLHEAGIAIERAQNIDLMHDLFSITTSWPEAFSVYRTLSRFATSTSSGARTAQGLDKSDYISLLQSLRTLTFPEGAHTALPAPPEDLLGIVQDMRAVGHRPSCAVYTSILDYYAKSAQPSFLGVRMTHDMLKRDEGLEPDLPLINALMNAYNRADEPAMVLAIWDSLMATRQEIDGVTLSVFFDTAGRHGLLSLARKAVGTLRTIEDQGAMTKGAWDSWLECLARCGRLEEAIEVAFGEMRNALFRQAIDAHDVDEASAGEGALTVTLLTVKSTQAPVKDRHGHVVGPDAKTMGTLLRFAARERDRRQKRLLGVLSGSTPDDPSRARGTSIWHTLRARIREQLSWLYPHVKHIGEDTLL
ncbi:conserved hypothetical protein [Sporisorium reilianum SRZ2]|uniref:Uncharacterized protein n=1 Tax=Sporisorium reilianum (strain SRZ2) TaxID=999809 RepID=E6ZLC5_SPORE|nr:conserved hypothetical protein [Sporisorium reilianum SRZ2]